MGGVPPFYSNVVKFVVRLRGALEEVNEKRGVVSTQDEGAHRRTEVARKKGGRSPSEPHQ